MHWDGLKSFDVQDLLISYKYSLLSVAFNQAYKILEFLIIILSIKNKFVFGVHHWAAGEEGSVAANRSRC